MFVCRVRLSVLSFVIACVRACGCTQLEASHKKLSDKVASMTKELEYSSVLQVGCLLSMYACASACAIFAYACAPSCAVICDVFSFVLWWFRSAECKQRTQFSFFRPFFFSLAICIMYM